MGMRFSYSFCNRWIRHSWGKCDTTMPLVGQPGRQTCRLCNAVRPCDGGKG